MPQLTINAWDFFYRDEGHGPLVILCHCSNASNKQWNRLIDALKGHYRVIAPDLAGYGKSGRWPDDRPFDPMIDIGMLRTLAELQPGPVHLAGHSYGAAMCLEAARLMGPRIASLTLIEPPSFHLLRLGGREREWRKIVALTDRVLTAMSQGDKRKAAGAYMGFWIGSLKWWLAPRKLKDAVLETMGKTAKEFEMIRAIEGDLGDYRAVAAPTQLIVGARTTAEAKSVTAILQSTIPISSVHTLNGAGHMSPFTHTEAINRLITAHIGKHRESASAAALS